jgi:hypothetical protein
LAVFNSYNGFIKFTVEIENDGILPFLDMEVHRSEDGSLSTTWYSKPSATNRIINYKSNHSFQIKLNCAQGLISRIFRLTTKQNMEKWCDNKCMEILGSNNYPNSLIRRLINKYKNPPEEEEPAVEVAKRKYRSLVYVKGVSEKIAKILKTTDPELQISFRNHKRTNQFFSILKDPIDPREKHNIIYQISCLHCLAVYIGLTTYMLKERLYRHQSSINKLEKASTPEEIEKAIASTALVKHMHVTGHKFDLQNAKVLIQTTRPAKLPIHEMLEIGSHPNSINLKTDTIDLSRSYIPIVDQFKRRRMSSQQK